MRSVSVAKALLSATRAPPPPPFAHLLMLSPGEVFFLEQACLAGVRADGRGPGELRKPEMQRGVTPGAQASVLVKLGECSLVMNAREIEAAADAGSAGADGGEGGQRKARMQVVDAGSGEAEGARGDEDNTDNTETAKHLFLRFKDTALSPPPIFGSGRRGAEAEAETRPDTDFHLAVVSLLARNVQRPARHEVYAHLLAGAPSYPTALSLGLYDVLHQLGMPCDCLLAVVARVADAWVPDPTAEEERASSALIIAALGRDGVVLDVMKTGARLLDVADIGAGLRAAREAGQRLWAQVLAREAKVE